MVAAKVLDFGVSKMLSAASQRLTRTGAVVGTVAYMAPEQMLDAREVDGRADLWSVGLVLYEALTRTHPFGASSAGPKVVTAILNAPVAPLRAVRPDAPPELEAVIGRFLQKDPDKRFATALDAALALAPFGTPAVRPVIDDMRRIPKPTGAAAPARRPRVTSGAQKTSRNVLTMMLGVLLILVLAAGVLYARQRALLPP
jgi:serine/threonine-protein kinase